MRLPTAFAVTSVGSSALYFSKPKCYNTSDGSVFFYSSLGSAYIGKELLADVKPQPNEMIEVEIVINKKNN